MNGRTLNRILWPIAGAALGFFASLALCGVRGSEGGGTAKAEVLLLGWVIHEESGPPGSGVFDRVVSTWGYGLMAAFVALGVVGGLGMAALVNRVSRATPGGSGANAGPGAAADRPRD